MPNQSELNAEAMQFIAPKPVVEAYAWGLKPVSGADPTALARKTSYGSGRVVHQLKIGTYGAVSGMLYNPNAPLGVAQRATNSVTGQAAFEFRTVSERAYDLYLSFLRTQQLVFVHQAQRELS